MLVAHAAISPERMMLVGLCTQKQLATAGMALLVPLTHYCGMVLAPLQIRGTTILLNFLSGYLLCS